jgi:hypothetical protein
LSVKLAVVGLEREVDEVVVDVLDSDDSHCGTVEQSCNALTGM